MTGHYKIKGKKAALEGHNSTYDSKLEAEWQFLFDETGIRAIPHPNTFQTHRRDGKRIITYTPDFYLPDYGIYGEVKPTDETLNSYDIQRKISAAMEDDCTPVSNGLMILGNISGFSANEKKKFNLEGEFYINTPKGIARSWWLMRQIDVSDERIGLYFGDTDYEDPDDFSHYPRFSRKASTYLVRRESGPLTSEIIYRAVFATIYAEKNGLIEEVSEKDEQQSQKDEPYPGFYDIYDDLSLPFDKD